MFCDPGWEIVIREGKLCIISEGPQQLNSAIRLQLVLDEVIICITLIVLL